MKNVIYITSKSGAMSDGKIPNDECDVKTPQHEPYFKALQRFQAEFLQDDIGVYDNVEDLINPPIKSGVILKNKRAFDRYYHLFRDLATFYSLQVPGDLLEKYVNGDDENTASIHSNMKDSLDVDLTDTTVIDDFAATYVAPHADPYVVLENILVMLYIKESLKPKLAELSKILRYHY